MDSGAPRPLLAMAAALLLALPALGSADQAQAATKHRHRPTPVVAVGQPAPSSMDSATAISCPDPKHCWAVGFGNSTTAAVDTTQDGGKKWSPQVVPGTVDVLAGVSCFDARHCMAVGSTASSGAVISTGDAGTSWLLDTAPTGAAAVTAVDCTSKLRCVVLATDGMTYWMAITDDLGQSWTREGDLPAGMIATSLTCPAPTACLAGGYTPGGPGQGSGALATTTTDGSTWIAATLPAGVGLVRGVSCAGSLCLAAGTSSAATTGYVPANGQLLTSIDAGATWVIDPGVALHDDAFGVACPNAKTCLVVGTDWAGKTQPVPRGSIVTTLDGGSQWRAASLKFVPVGLASVACPAVNSCTAVGGNVFVHVSLPVALPRPKHPTSTTRVPNRIR